MGRREVKEGGRSSFSSDGLVGIKVEVVSETEVGWKRRVGIRSRERGSGEELSLCRKR